jgi:hypothetical protein
MDGTFELGESIVGFDHLDAVIALPFIDYDPSIRLSKPLPHVAALTTPLRDSPSHRCKHRALAVLCSALLC